MSRARNRADGDFGDLDITNIGAVSLDSIKGDAEIVVLLVLQMILTY